MLRIGDTDYPVRIDLNVMEALEEEFETVEKFKQKLLGFEYLRDADGEVIIDDEGRPKIKQITPSIKALKFILPLMINEGIKFEAFEQRKPYDPVDPEYINTMCEIPREQLMKAIFEEFERAEKTKKEVPGKNGTGSRKK